MPLLFPSLYSPSSLLWLQVQVVHYPSFGTLFRAQKVFSILSFNGISNSTVLFMVLCLQFFQGLTCWSLRMRTSYPRKRAVSLLCVIRVFSWLSSIFSPLRINSVSFPLIHSQSALLPLLQLRNHLHTAHISAFCHYKVLPGFCVSLSPILCIEQSVCPFLHHHRAVQFLFCLGTLALQFPVFRR